MRGAGSVHSARRLGPHDHLCWIYDDRAEFCAAGVAFLEDGLALGERVLYLGDRSDDELCGELAALGDVDGLRAAGALEVIGLQQAYVAGPPDTGTSGPLVRAAQAAVAEGFTGLRVASDGTALALDPAARDTFARDEHVVDRLMAGGLPLTGMCAFDRSVLAAAVDDLASIHPLVHGSSPPFRVFATGTDAVAIVGEVDAMCATAFEVAIRRVLTTSGGDDTAVDCAGLRFIDQRGLTTLDATARTALLTLTLHDVPDAVARMADLLPLEAVRIA